MQYTALQYTAMPYSKHSISPELFLVVPGSFCVGTLKSSICF